MSNPIYQPWTKPFQSGSSICYPSTDKAQYMNGGAKRKAKGKGKAKRGRSSSRRRHQRGGNATAVQQALRVPSTPADLAGNGFGAASLADHLTGEGVHTAPQPMTEQFRNTNMGLNWATNGGAKKLKKAKSSKKSTKKVKSMKRRSTRKTRRQHGGVTPLPMRYFNPDHNSPTANNSSGEPSAYGDIVGHSFPSTNLAPFPNSSGQMTGGSSINDKWDVSGKISNVTGLLGNVQSQNDAMNHKSGGAKKRKSPTKKRSTTKRSKSPTKKRSTTKKTKSPTKKRRSPKKRSLLDRMTNSVKRAASSVKRGLSPKRISRSLKKTASKVKRSLTPKRKSSSRKQKGGGSDWRMSQYSRGAYDNPNMPESQFRAFNKSSAYIPNTKLWEFATPLLNNSDVNVPAGPAPVQRGAAKAKKRTTTKKRSTSTKKRKSPTKKRSTTTKKRSTTTKKRKSPTKKRR